MGTAVAVLEAMAHVTAKGLGSEDKDPFLTWAGSSISHAVDERPVYYSMTWLKQTHGLHQCTYKMHTVI